jgi:hypothetical protein
MKQMVHKAPGLDGIFRSMIRKKFEVRGSAGPRGVAFRSKYQ